uniref:Toll-like receptor 7-like n=1 Tax=Phallusia mammillata TaxID=59560 RepID=A0A6F9DJB1_9ASCI|nr:toll-like receptor 7-like precursor [Phallusia mammillata]
MRSGIHFLTALAWSMNFLMTEGGYRCIEKCSCTQIDQVSSANCTGLNLTTVPIPDVYQVDVLILDFNKLSYIARDAFMRYTSLTDVRLTGNRIRSIEGEAFVGLGRSNLKRLDLSLNRLSSLPTTELRRISHSIEFLSVAYNRLTTFPAALDEMTQLQELDVSHNSIKAMPNEQLPASLIKLNIAYTTIGKFSKRSFSTTPNLQELRMSDNLASGAVRFEDGTFDVLTGLRYLDMSRCFCRHLPRASFVKLSNLTTLLLRKSYLRQMPQLTVHIPQQADTKVNLTVPPVNSGKTPLDGDDQLIFRKKRTTATSNKTVDPALDVQPQTPTFRWCNPQLQSLDLSQNRRLKVTSPTGTANAIFPPALVNLDLSLTSLDVLRSTDLSNLKQLKYLKLCSTGLTSINPGALDPLYNLTSICLSNNPLTQPPSIPSSVQEINMTQTDLVALTRSFLGNLTNAVTLDFNKGFLRHIEDGSFTNLLQLRMLNLSTNKLQKISEQSLFVGNVSENSSLLALDLSNNAIAVVDDLAFVSHSYLLELRLGSNDLTEITERTLLGLGSLKTLDLSRNLLIDVAPNALRDLRNVEEIYLNNNELEVIYPEQFGSTPMLTRLYLTDNRLLIVHKQSFPSLVELVLRRNNLTTFPVIDAPVLTDVDVSQNELTEISTGSLKGLSNLLRLDLHENSELAFSNYSVFAEAPRLTVLNLADCSAYQFVETHLQSLKVLLFTRNFIGYVSKPVEQYLPSIQRIDLSFNNLTTLLPEMVNNSQTLTSLDLTGNNFQCDCHLAPLVTWISHQIKHDLVDVVGALSYLCDGPPAMYARSVVVAVSRMDCTKPPPEPQPSGSPLSLVAVEVIFGCLTAVVLAISVVVACYCRRRAPHNSSSSSLSSVGQQIRSPRFCCDWFLAHWCGRMTRPRGATGEDEERDLMGPTPTPTPTDTQPPILL